MAQSYIYRSLSSSSTIRLIKILPQRADGSVRCILHHFDSSDVPPYTALSYLWGDPSPAGSVHIGDDPSSTFVHPLHKNLLRFVECMWSQCKYDTFFWIDSLCLNQLDVKEKSQQVPHMGSIYEGAAEVLIWLGHQLETETALATVAEYIATDEGEQTNSTREKANIQDPNLYRLKKRTKKAMRDLLQLPYWRRTWIIQEVALAKRGQVASGRLYIDLDAFDRVSTMGAGRDVESFLMYSLLRELRINGRRSLWKLLMAFSKGRQSSRRIDRIYGLLGMATDVENGTHISDLIEVNYEKTPQEVYWDAMFECKAFAESFRSAESVFRIPEEALGQHTSLYRSLEEYTWKRRSGPGRKGVFGSIALQLFDAANTFVLKHGIPLYMWNEAVKRLLVFISKSSDPSSLEHAVFVGLALSSVYDQHNEWVNGLWLDIPEMARSGVVHNRPEDGHAVGPETEIARWRRIRLSMNTKGWQILSKGTNISAPGSTMPDTSYVFDFPEVSLRVTITMENKPWVEHEGEDDCRLSICFHTGE